MYWFCKIYAKKMDAHKTTKGKVKKQDNNVHNLEKRQKENSILQEAT